MLLYSLIPDVLPNFSKERVMRITSMLLCLGDFVNCVIEIGSSRSFISTGRRILLQIILLIWVTLLLTGSTF
ncbi:hypothetical protein LINGRAHAP2_LOCUS11095 [Linum grandiflorum]